MTDSELESLKNRLTEEYRANGGKRDVSSLSATMIMNEIDHLKEKKKLEDEILKLRNNQSVEPEKPAQTQFFGRINAAQVNKELVKQASEVLGGYMDYLDPPFDTRELEDERFKRDNAVAKLCIPGQEDTVVILRDKDGRMA